MKDPEFETDGKSEGGILSTEQADQIREAARVRQANYRAPQRSRESEATRRGRRKERDSASLLERQSFRRQSDPHRGASRATRVCLQSTPHHERRNDGRGISRSALPRRS